MALPMHDDFSHCELSTGELELVASGIMMGSFPIDPRAPIRVLPAPPQRYYVFLPGEKPIRWQ